MAKAAFTLEPLTCPSCVKRIEKNVGNMQGVEDVRVLFHANRVRTVFDDTTVGSEDIKATIEKLGFPVVSVRVS
ncbi:MAG TPA: heavy-metal-associated domain-containing protein [Bacillota bacterium]|nr:heavy-metal-associated domain-containing protein [Bacillota bacterium]